MPNAARISGGSRASKWAAMVTLPLPPPGRRSGLRDGLLHQVGQLALGLAEIHLPCHHIMM
jgi:hypothetical protein